MFTHNFYSCLTYHTNKQFFRQFELEALKEQKGIVMKQIQRCLFSFTFILLLSIFCFGQEKIRSVGKEFQFNKVIDLVELKIKDKTFKLNEKIPSDKDWIKNLTFRLINVSDKAICYAEINLVIQPVGKMKYPLQLTIQYGMLFNQAKFIEKKAVSNYSQKIQPGETFDASIDEHTKKFLDH